MDIDQILEAMKDPCSCHTPAAKALADEVVRLRGVERSRDELAQLILKLSTATSTERVDLWLRAGELLASIDTKEPADGKH